MDYYNFSPNFADSLNLFGPTTQRALVNNCTKVLPYECLSHTDKTQWLRYCPSINNYNRERSSTSLFVGKTTVRQQSPHLRNYCRSPSFTQSARLRQEESHEDRPLVQITVIPKNSTKVRKRRPGSKTVQNTASNQERSIKANNVYFVVAGKRQKVIKIKTSESAELSSSNQTYTKNEEGAIERNLNQLLNSLDMDKKKKAKRKKEEEDEELNERVSISSMANVLDDDVTCLCSDGLNVNQRKSRVRITGRLGLTDGDKYVLKCAATVDDKPIAMNYMRESNRYNGGTPCVECKEGDAGTRKRIFCQREANVQANMLRSEEQSYNYCQANNCPAVTFNSYRSVETQCSPCNFNSVCFANIEKLRISSNRDQIVQCNCPTYPTNSALAGAEYGREYSTPKGGGNPLVIISVYQKRDSADAIPGTKSPAKEECSSPPEGSIISLGKKGKGGKKKDDGDKTLRSRSPSPEKGKAGKKAEDKKGKGKAAKPAKKGECKKESEQKNPLVSKSTNTDSILNIAKQSNSEPKVHNSPQVNTSVMNWVTAKKDASNNVAINVANDKESYNVLVYQSSLSTDLHISKRVKDQSSVSSVRDDSLENLFIDSEDEQSRNISLSQMFLLNDQTNAEVELAWTKANQELKVQDSLEVTRRREEEVSHVDLKTISNTSTSTQSEGNQKCVTTKHFKGDNCSISNPMERDKEIRELLGVKWKKSSNKTSTEIHIQEATTKTDEESFLYHKKRSTKSEVKIRKSNQTVTNTDDVTSTRLFQDALVQKNDFAQQTTPRTSQTKVEWIYRRVQCPYLADTTENPPSDDMIIVEPRLSQMHLYKQFFSKRYDSLQTSKQKPIILSRKHYAKLKRVIEMNAVKKARLIDSFSKRKTICYSFNHNRDIKLKKTHEKQKYKQVNHVSEQTQTKKQLGPKDKTNKNVNRKNDYKNQFAINDKLKDQHNDNVYKQHKKRDKEVLEEALFDAVVTKAARSQPIREYSGYQRHRTEFVTRDKSYYRAQQQRPEIFMMTEHTRHSASSTRLHYSSLTFMRKVTFSATHVPRKSHHSRKHYPMTTPVPPEPPPHVEFNNYYSNSLHTIFKGHKKSPTPNLGTSECSLNSGSLKSNAEVVPPESPESQHRKPFLKRLMSCLVMRSKVSGTKIAKRKPNEILSGESSVDTYHISSSLGAIEMSSSIYDTATSFYSNHSIHQIGSKTKRGFLNSVREYLTIRK